MHHHLYVDAYWHQQWCVPRMLCLWYTRSLYFMSINWHTETIEPEEGGEKKASKRIIADWYAYGTAPEGTYVHCCTVPYYTILYCTALYCTVLHCTALYCTVLYCTVLYCTVLYCTVLTYLSVTRSYCLLLLLSILIRTLTSSLLGKHKKVQGAKGKRRNLAKAETGRYGVMVGPRVELRMRARGGKDSVVTSLVWHHKVSRWVRWVVLRGKGREWDWKSLHRFHLFCIKMFYLDWL